VNVVGVVVVVSAVNRGVVVVVVFDSDHRLFGRRRLEGVLDGGECSADES